MNSFEDIRMAKTNDEISDATVKLEGAKECSIKKAARPPSNDTGMQFVCHGQKLPAQRLRQHSAI